MRYNSHGATRAGTILDLTWPAAAVLNLRVHSTSEPRAVPSVAHPPSCLSNPQPIYYFIQMEYLGARQTITEQYRAEHCKHAHAQTTAHRHCGPLLFSMYRWHIPYSNSLAMHLPYPATQM